MDILSMLQADQRVEITFWRGETDDEGTTFPATIHWVSNNRFFVVPPYRIFQDHTPHWTPGTLVGVLFIHNNLPVVFYPRIESVQATTPEGVWFLIPDDVQVEVNFKREFVRVEIERPLLAESKTGEDIQPAKAITTDLSGGGVKFTCNRLFARDEELLLRLNLNDEHPDLHLEGKVVFCSDNPNAGQHGHSHVVACRFTGTTDQNQMLLVGECFRAELASRKRKTD